jgi:adenosylhomocysteine nucleosidase
MTVPPDIARHVSRIGGLSVLFVMATEQEYGPHLRKRINPLMVGVGPVEAAVDTGVALSVLRHAGHLPDLVFSLGSAGSRNLENAEVYQIESVAYRDIDASLLGFEKGVTPFLNEPAVIAIPHQIPGIRSATLSTGGTIVSGADFDAIEADMVDMETYAVLRAAKRFAVPTIGLRGISDGKADLTGFHDWTEYLHIIDEKLAAAIDAFADHAGAGRFRIER